MITHEEKQKAWTFLLSDRGQYVLGQALCIAVKTLDRVQGPERERSNIDDMKYLQMYLFPMYAEVQAAMAAHQDSAMAAALSEADSFIREDL
jgi:hypothetical protein